ncbi:two-component sensor histidine kinase [Actinoplanes italicus]|uniref:histidine kinase n=1 Tax=Actinoplanes italicus TaxID=113567 RepID=A0A2T0JXA2_9ACTN|nr:histidine kinase [Actinoplanes italicus]PRX12637.1 signal transduction histidine kinase [Actinoplanes italicus]GIE35405.1 two-component sensor histidine kinase [Actinoplanes italicus]
MIIARWRERIAGAGAWRLIYEVSLVTLLSVATTVSAVSGDWYPLAPWLVGITTPILMLLRLIHPLGAYAAAALVGLGTGGQGFVLLAVLSASLGYRAARAWQVVAGLVVGWICFVLSVLWEMSLTLEWAILVSSFFAFLACAPAGVARLVRRRRILLAAMHHRNVQLHSGQAEIARQAQIRERARIARDLHDSLGNRLTLISLYAGMMRTDEADLIRQASSSAMTELRQILGLLGQDGTQPQVRPLSGLDELAEQARASGARVEIVREGEPRPVPAMTEHAAYRVVQEGLTNALRHAHGGSIEILLRYESDALIARVTNTAGRPAVQETSGQGLLGLTERVRVAGGVLFHGPTPDGGFRLAATLAYTGDEPPPPPAVATNGADFVSVVERHSRRSRIVLATTAVSIAGFLVLCGSGAWLMTAMVSVDRETYDAIRIGQSETAVRAVLPEADVAEPGAPAGCVDYPAGLLEQLRVEDGEMIYRFCFRDGTLVDKQEWEKKS